jgi:hypothetical protein
MDHLFWVQVLVYSFVKTGFPPTTIIITTSDQVSVIIICGACLCVWFGYGSVTVLAETSSWPCCFYMDKLQPIIEFQQQGFHLQKGANSFTRYVGMVA